MVQRLKTFDEVISALGGVAAVARLCGVRPPGVCHWRVRHKQFPAEYFWIMTGELDRLGYTVPRTLFTFADERRRRTP